MLIQDIKPDSSFPEELEGEVFFPLFNKKIKVCGFSPDNVEYANECAKLLTELNDNVVKELCLASIRYCNAFLEAVGEKQYTFDNERDVLAMIEPRFLLIEQDETRPAIHMELGCDWEEEHGMEWAIRDGKVVYVSSYNGVSPFDDFTEKDEWNFAQE